MNIAWIEPASPTTQGDQFYRTIQPAQALAQDPNTCVVAGSYLHPAMHRAAQEADLLVLCQAIDPDFLPLMELRRQRERPTLMELNDNFLEPTPFGEVGSFYHQPAQRALAMQLAQRADGLVVSTPYLGNLFGHLNANRLVLTNSVNTLPPARPPSAPNGSMRVGWAGSAGHAKDLTALMPVLQAALARHPHVILCIMAPAALHPLFAWVPANRMDLREGGSLDAYLAFIATWDVGLAPLNDTPFNRGRSDVKFLEYAQNSVPTIASRGPAYSAIVDGETGLLANTLPDFLGLLSRLIMHPTLRHTLAENAYQYVATKRCVAQTHQALTHFVAGLNIKPTPTTRTPSAWLRRHAPKGFDAGTARMAYLPYGPLEVALFLGLQASAQPDKALPYLNHAMQLAPSFYLPRLYAGTLPSDPRTQRAHLDAARDLAPHSVAVVHHLAAHDLRQNNPAGVIATCTKPPASLGDYAPTYTMLAQAYGALGETRLQHQTLRQALKINCWFRAPAAHLAELALRKAMAPSAEAQHLAAPQDADDVAANALAQSMTLLPGAWRDAFLLAELFLTQGRLPEARAHMEQALGWAQATSPSQSLQHCSAKLAQICLQMGDIRAASSYLQRAKASAQA